MEQYGQITLKELKIECVRFIAVVDKEIRAQLNNVMMHQYVMASFIMHAKLQLIAH